MAGARHDMCELALKVHLSSLSMCIIKQLAFVYRHRMPFLAKLQRTAEVANIP